MIRALALALALALAAPVNAACVQQGFIVNPLYTPGTGEAKITLRVNSTLFFTFTTADPTLKLLLAIYAEDNLRVTGDAASCPLSGIERAGGAITSFVPIAPSSIINP